MGGNNLLQVLIASINAKITPLVTKIRLWTSWNFIRTKLITELRSSLVRLFDVRPKHKKDYYEVLGWLVSKKLAFAAVVVIGVLSIYYLLSAHTAMLSPAGAAGKSKTYSYNSLLLRMAKGDVKITGKSGYLAYEGKVESGACMGNGTLYNPAGGIVYRGGFENSRYEGNGTFYYPTGTVRYQGSFHDNLYEGIGKLYRENGILAYEGAFSRGRKEGAGKLYDNSGNAVYEGEFAADELVYAAFLGKTTSEITGSEGCYRGRRIAYEGDGELAVVMQEIDAVYTGAAAANALKEETQVEQIYVLQDTLTVGEVKCTTVEELNACLGAPIYEGNSEMTLTEAVCLSYLESLGRASIEMEALETTPVFDDYVYVNTYDTEQAVYLYTYRQDGLIYTFVCRDRQDGFLFYSIQSEEGGSAA